MVNNTYTAVLVAALAAALTGCGATGGGSPPASTPGVVPVSVQASRGPVTIVKGRSPVQLYAHVARQVRACWFNPRKPLLEGYIFRGEAGAGGRSGRETNIAIYTRTPDNRRGLKAFSIELVDERVSTRVVAENHKLPDALGRRFIADVSYWAQGGENCSGALQTAVGARGASR